MIESISIPNLVPRQRVGGCFETKDFVICCDQITKTFCSKYGCTSVFSARSPCNLCILANVAVSVLWEIRKDTVPGGSDVGDALEVELEEPVDNPGTTIGTWFSVLHRIFLPFFLTHMVASSFVCTSPLVQLSLWNFVDACTVFNSAGLKSFLLSMCIDTPEPTTNYLSSGFITDGAGRHQTSVGEKKLASSL